MARARTIKRSSRRSKSRSRKSKSSFSFLPVPAQVFLARRLVDIFASIFLIAGLFILVSLMSYNHQDPSWNTASIASAKGSADIANWGGKNGAWISDMLLQTLGIGGFALAFGLMIWGLRAFRREPLSPLWLRMISLLVSSIAFSVAFAQIPSHGWTVHPYLGSSAGTLLLGRLNEISPALGQIGIPAIAGLAGLGTFIFAAAVSREEILSALYTVQAFVMNTAFLIYSAGCSFIGWVQHYNDPDYLDDMPSFFERFSALRERTMRIGADEEEDEYEDDDDEEYEDEDDEEYESPSRSRQKTAPTIPVVTQQTNATQRKKATTQHRFNLNSDGEEWELPDIDLLQEIPESAQGPHMNEDALRKNAELLQNILADFNIEGEITSIHPGPVVTLYELEPAPGVKSSRVIALADDIARSMSAISVRIAVVPGRNVIGIELPNKTRQIVYMQELLASKEFGKTKAHLPLILGKDIGGQPIMADLARMPHLLVAGTTGSGKSVAVNTMILSLLYCLPPEKCRFIMIDPKMLELSVYDDIPHLLSPVVTEPGKAIVALKWAVAEMEERYRAMSKLGVRNIEGYNERMREAQKSGETLMRKVQTGFDEAGKPVFEDQPMDMSELPYIVIVVDEFADLMLVAGKDVENAIQRLAQMARAAGLHLIMATQRPSVDVITGVIKANFPTRISFAVTSKIDSRTILGEGGAEQLLGMGDMLYMAPGGRITRVHGPFVSDGDVENVTNFLREQAEPAYLEDITEEDGFDGSEVMDALFGGSGGSSDVDELYDQAVALVAREGKASTSFVQRYLQIGYNRAARIIEEMERQGVISKATATGKREVLISDYSDV